MIWLLLGIFLVGVMLYSVILAMGEVKESVRRIHDDCEMDQSSEE